MPIMESTITLANHQLFILPSDGEDYISSSSSRKSWQSPGGVLVEAPLLNDNLPRPSIDPYKAIPYFLPRESTDTYDYEDAINKPYPPYESRHFTSNVTPIAESSPGTVDGTLTATNAILSNLDISPNPTSLTWNSEKVSSTAFVNLYTSCLTSLTIPLRTTLTLPLVSSHKDIQKSFERGKMIRECIDLIDLEVDLEGDDRDLVYERLCGDERLGPLKVNILNHLTKSWRADQKSVPKIEIFVERCVKWWCMAGAVSGGLVCSSGDGFDPMRHTFEDGHGDKVYCLIPGLIRGDQIVFREIVSNCVLEEVSTCGERRSFDDTKGRLDPVPSDKRLSV